MIAKSLFSFFSLKLENLGNFIKAILAYGLKPNDIFEANDLFENGNLTQVQTTLLALANMVSTVQNILEEMIKVWIWSCWNNAAFILFLFFFVQRQKPKVWTQKSTLV